MEFIYLRFGNLPQRGRSAHVDGYLEAGVSVFEGLRFGGKIYVNISGNLKWALATYLEEGRPCWEVRGRETDIGGDGEPLLEEVVKKKKIQNPSGMIPIDAKNEGWPSE